MGIRYCLVCGDSFEYKWPKCRQKYCSDECNPHIHKRERTRCITCGAVLTGKRKKFCSSCRPVYKRVSPRNCVVCGEPLPKYKKKYCSPKCMPWELDTSERVCIVCNKLLPRYKEKYCSDSCATARCVDCSAAISYGATRCVDCERVYHREYRVNDPEYLKNLSDGGKAAWTAERRAKQSEQAKSMIKEGIFGPSSRSLDSFEKQAVSIRKRWAEDETFRARMMKMYGSPEHRLKLSKTVKAKYQNDPVYRHKISRSRIGMKFSEEHRRNISKSKTGVKYGPPSKSTREKIATKVRLAHRNGCYDNAPKKISKAIKTLYRDGHYNEVFRSPTNIETEVSNALDKFSVKHKSQFSPDGCSRIYDELVYPNVLLEVHGSYWHSSARQQEIDLEKARWAHDAGYKFIAIWDFHLEEYGANFLVEKWILPLDPEKVSDTKREMASLF